MFFGEGAALNRRLKPRSAGDPPLEPSSGVEQKTFMEIPRNFTKESFYGFDMDDDEVGPGEYRSLAIELKHLFEAIANDADEKNEEVFFTRDLDHAVRRFLVDPTKPSLDHLLDVSPTFNPYFEEMQSLLRMKP